MEHKKELIEQINKEIAKNQELLQNLDVSIGIGLLCMGAASLFIYHQYSSNRVMQLKRIENLNKQKEDLLKETWDDITKNERYNTQKYVDKINELPTTEQKKEFLIFQKEKMAEMKAEWPELEGISYDNYQELYHRAAELTQFISDKF